MERCVPKSYAGPDSVYIIKRYFTLGIYVLLLGLSGISHVFKASTEPSPSPPVLQTLPAAASRQHLRTTLLPLAYSKTLYLINCLISAFVLATAAHWSCGEQQASRPQRCLWTRRPRERRREGDGWSWVPGKASPGSPGFAALFSAVATDFLRWEEIWIAPWIVSILCWNKEYDLKILLLLLFLLLLIIYLWKL